MGETKLYQVNINGNLIEVDIVGKVYSSCHLFEGRMEPPFEMRERLLLINKTGITRQQRLAFASRWPLDQKYRPFLAHMCMTYMALGVLCRYTNTVGHEFRTQDWFAYDRGTYRDLPRLVREYLLYSGFPLLTLRRMKALAELRKEVMGLGTVKKYLSMEREEIEDTGFLLRVRQEVWVWTDITIMKALINISWEDIYWAELDANLARLSPSSAV